MAPFWKRAIKHRCHAGCLDRGTIPFREEPPPILAGAWLARAGDATASTYDSRHKEVILPVPLPQGSALYPASYLPQIPCQITFTLSSVIAMLPADGGTAKSASLSHRWHLQPFPAQHRGGNQKYGRRSHAAIIHA